ncbi:transposase [Serratia marcescens]|uniref:Transposase n=1 Tax=Serratia marcescens TaxID=615 RepID=A0A939SVK6_SERMA|nr:transposase [Serratia marcescens]
MNKRRRDKLVQAVLNRRYFAEKLKGYAGGIIASARHRLNTSVLEGMNNKIKVMKRMVWIPDNAYFFLKIKAAFPVKRDEPFFFARRTAFSY